MSAVSVIIPTMVQRPALLCEAVASALVQEDVDVEIVIVVDGPGNPRVPDELVRTKNLRVVELSDHFGQSEALNRGVEVAEAPWVAFLDDDDLWHRRDKLARQIAVASVSPLPIIVGSLVLLLVNGAARVAPHRALRDGEDLGEFAFCADRRLRLGISQQSSLLTSRDVARRHPFDPRAGPHMDIDWQLSAIQSGARFAQIDEALSTWRIDDDRTQLHINQSWRVTADWCALRAPMLTPTAIAGAMLTNASRATDARRAMPSIWRTAFRLGAPRGTDLLASLAFAYTPRAVRRRLARIRAVPEKLRGRR
jgi:glycosyltransferase involved in cell wall biosynthesis